VVAYSFKQIFIEPIEAGTKRQTMRNERERHVRVGEEIQLYYGMRTRHCRLIGRALCAAVTPVALDFMNDRVVIGDGTPGIRVLGTFRKINDFARADGFRDWNDLIAFWAKEHPKVPDRWSGVLIEWTAFRSAAIIAA
jgi:hypothetical protein